MELIFVFHFLSIFRFSKDGEEGDWYMHFWIFLFDGGRFLSNKLCLFFFSFLFFFWIKFIVQFRLSKNVYRSNRALFRAEMTLLKELHHANVYLLDFFLILTSVFYFFGASFRAKKVKNRGKLSGFLFLIFFFYTINL